MDTLEERLVSCPYCGEPIDVLIDHQEVGHEYIEDCQVCCRPIVFNVQVDAGGEVVVGVRDENEPY